MTGKTVIWATILFFIITGCVACPKVDAQPPTGWDEIFGILWYLRSFADDDDLTHVYGGVDGSSVLVYRDYDNGKSHWVFLEGGPSSVAFLSMGAGMPHELSTNVRGEFLTSTTSFTWSGPKVANKRDLSYYLVDAYEYSLLDSQPGTINHVPFLRGKGWTLGGAMKNEAKLLVEGVGLTFAIDPTGDQTGFVVEDTVPINGSLLTAGSTVTVKLQQVMVAGITTGDTWQTAMAITDDDGDKAATATGVISVDHTQTASSPIHPNHPAHRILNPGMPIPQRRDIFFRLPAEAQGKIINVSQTSGHYESLMLSVKTVNNGQLVDVPWGGKKYAAVNGMRPQLQFFNPPETTCYLMVEHRFRDVATISLDVKWE
jgi:hypothetical protein